MNLTKSGLKILFLVVISMEIYDKLHTTRTVEIPDSITEVSEDNGDCKLGY